MELMKNLGFVKVEGIQDDMTETSGNIKTGFEEMKQIKQGKLKTIPPENFLNEL